MTDGWRSIKIRSFEHVTAGASTSLLRLSGTAAQRPTAPRRPQLVLDNDGERYRYAALAAPDDPPGTLRAAYSLPSSLIGPTSTYWLEHPDGSLTELPRPAASHSHAEPTQTAAQAALAAAEAENQQLSATLEELDTWRGELERRLAATTDELSAAKAAREADQREIKRLEEALAEAQSGRDGGDSPTAEASDTVAAQAIEIELLVAELASVRTELARRGLDPGSETPDPDSTGDGSVF
ncbi:MAG TPA: hypothetical protein VGL51_12100 [Solirubrobacteraceae bacterium]